MRYVLLGLLVPLVLLFSAPVPQIAGYQADPSKYPLLTRLTSEVSSCPPNNIDRMLLLNAWIYQSLSVKDYKRDSNLPCLPSQYCLSEETLSLLDGICGHRATLMIDVANNLNISSTRDVKFFDVPIAGSHVACEINIAGSWHFFDPTFGIYFVEPTRPDTPLSIQQAQYLYPDIQVRKAQVPGWLGEWSSFTELQDAYAKGTLYANVIDSFFTNPYHNWLSYDIATTYFITDAIFDDENQIFEKPVYLDARDKISGKLGEANARWDDMTQYIHEVNYGQVYHPYLYLLGRDIIHNTPNIIHRYSVISSAPGDFLIELTLIEPVPEDAIKYFLTKVEQAVLDWSPESNTTKVELTEKTLRVSCKTRPPITTLSIWLAGIFSRNHGFHIDCIDWSFSPD